MKKSFAKRILAMVACLLLVFAIMPDMAAAEKDAGAGSSLSTSTWNTISIPGNIIHVPQCNELIGKVENANFIVASKTNSEKDKGFIVWTLNELNERAKADIIKAICQKSTWADFKKLDDNKLPVTFAYGDTSKLGDLIKNAVIKPLDQDGNVIQIEFSAKRIWTKYMYGTYIYTPEPVTVELAAKKYLEDNDGEEMDLSGGEFTFVIKGGAEDVYATNDENGNIKFTVSLDSPGDYEYTIKEVDGHQPGYTYDGKELKYKVNVNDEDNDGKLDAKITESPEEAEAVFANTYNEPDNKTVEATITATKVLHDADGNNMELEDGQFTFLLYEGETVNKSNLLGSTTNDKYGNISFTRTFTENELGEEHYFTIAEADDGKTGYEYSNATFTYKVTFTQAATLANNNALVPNVELVKPENVDEAVFTNRYIPNSTTEGITAMKVLKDADGNIMDLEEGQFQFQLKDKYGEVIQTVGNAADGSITFSAITYNREGTYRYTVNEVKGAAAGYEYDDKVLSYEVTVRDDGGQLKAEVNSPEDMTFNNTYKPISTTAKITAQKELRDADGNIMDLEEGQFEFQLKDNEGNVIDTVGNAADGSIAFGEIKFDRAGTYKYTVNEVIPEVEEEGYTYDKNVFNYEVVVRDDGGQLIAELYAPDDTTFNNSYELEDIPDDPTPLSAGGIIATKALEGKKLTANQFQFQLRDEDGKLIETVYNTADGKIIFSPIEYKRAGTYIFKVNEVDAGEEGYTYDNSVFEYKVVVEEKDGRLVATVYAPEDTTFNNSYDLEDIPEEPVPQTGDALNNGAYMMSALAALCAAAIIISRKRKAGSNNR